MNKWIVAAGLILLSRSGQAQVLTREDSLNAGLSPSARNVIIAGYGEAKVSYDANMKTAEANLTRNVLFVGYKFKNRITFFSELEVEDTKVDADGGEIAMEQCLLKFDVGKGGNYLMAGLILPRIGIMNENHLPTTFNGNDRPFVERWVIPSTWRELGVVYYGTLPAIPGLHYSAGVLNGLNAEGIAGGSGIREARFEGREATASNIALTGAVLYYLGGLRLQASTYYGGTVGMSERAADSLGLDAGAFGTPVWVSEANAQFQYKGWSVKALGVFVNVPDADALNRAFATNAATRTTGYYAELAYNLTENNSAWKDKGKKCLLFARYESMDLMADTPYNGIKDELYHSHYLVAGVTYIPAPGVSVKADWVHSTTGAPNPFLHINNNPNAPAYLPENNHIQLGVAYSF
ncbi:MAG: hypothetical protein H6585_11355 [Flavobacteriales bacterium]|nr:hypothetical protein [Flavobacteriales bacterium]MCB9448931.1 hypothetical protein [Flavobacteriales bacterium]